MPEYSTPGVYVSEIPTGRQITPVATSVTAFLGRAARGPVGQATACYSFGDFERQFGGLWARGPLSYSVRDFFNNGGGEALVVRLYSPAGPEDDGIARLTVGGLALQAASPGAWGDQLSAKVTASAAAGPLAASLGLEAGDFFDLTVVDAGSQASETFHNLTCAAAGGASRIDAALAGLSALVRVQRDAFGQPILPAGPPADGATGEASGGDDGALLADADILGSESQGTGLWALNRPGCFNLMVIPPDADGVEVSPAVWDRAAAFCSGALAFLIVDAPAAWTTVALAQQGQAATPLVSYANAANAALYFPRLVEVDPLDQEQFRTIAPSGAIAGVYAATDTSRGVWKAPAGIGAALQGVNDLTIQLNDQENGLLNPIAVNCLRKFPIYGPVVWGARTLRGADALADDFKYVPVRRLALFIEASLRAGLAWTVFEPNGPALWAAIRLAAGSFMQALYQQGAFFGPTASAANFVKCDATTTTAQDMLDGVVNLQIGFAPIEPAEFLVLQIQLTAAAAD
jgi:phage tail sheath protein FI